MSIFSRRSSVQSAVIETLEERRLLSVSAIEQHALGSLPTLYSTASLGSLSVHNPTDTYTFTLTKTTELNIGLSKMTADANLLLKRADEIIGVSRHGGRENDAIRKILPVGTYQLSVIAPDIKTDTPYRLAITSRNAAPTDVEASKWGGNSGFIRWIDNAQNETGYRIDQWRGRQWKTIRWVPADTTIAVISGLVPDASTSYRVRAMTDMGSLPSQGFSMLATAQASTQGYYRVSSIAYAGSPEAGWNYVESPNNRLRIKDAFVGKWVYAGSWQEAVASVVEGTITIDSGSGPVVHNIQTDGDFWIDEAIDIAGWINLFGSDDCDLPAAGKIIALEDSYGGIDEDYDDFYWAVETDFQTVDLDIDSDNNDGFNSPDGSEEEDVLEADTSTGKIISANTGDLDQDGVIDNEDLNGINGAQFVPIVLRRSADILPGNDVTPALFRPFAARV
jgi:hypothetical protein